MLKRTNQSGDTLIEVLFAVTVFSLIVVTALSIMNQGSSAVQRSLEISLVRQQIDNQAETIRFLHEAYVTNYKTGYSSNPDITVDGPAGQFYALVHDIDGAGRRSASEFGNLTSCPNPPTGSFILNTRTATIITNPSIFNDTTTYSQLVYSSDTATTPSNSSGLWIEAIRSLDSTDTSQANSGYIDFHIRACWDAPGSDLPTTLGTIVRLYEPRG